MIIFSQKCLRQALHGLRVLKVNKQKLDPLHCVFIRGIGETVVFEATNLDEHLSFEARGETDTPGSQHVPYDLLNDALMSSDPDSTVTINPGHDLSYIAGGSKLSIPLPELKPEDWPPTPAAAGNAIPLPAGVLGSMVEGQGCASTDSKRYLLNSVLLSRHEVVATDGRQLYLRNGLELLVPEKGLIFPLSGVPGVLNGDHCADLWAWDLKSSPKAMIAQGPWRWITKLVDGDYPNYRQVIPRVENYGSVIQITEVDATRLMSVLPRLPGFKESSSPVRLSITGSQATLCPPARLPQVVVALDRSAVTGTSPNAVQFNAGFLLAALKRGFRELCVKDEVSPLLMRDASRINLWMPVRMDASPVPAPAEPEASPATSNPQPETSTMIAIKSTPAAEPAPAARIPATTEVASESSPIDTLQRAKDLLRELQTVLTDASVAVRDLAREKRGVERDLESLKRNLRVLKAVEV